MTLDRSDRDRLLLWGLATVGAVLRLRQFAVDRSLWLDEAMIALNIVDRSPVDLVSEPLDLNQVAPPGFLLAEAAVEAVLGSDPQALRLVPVLASLVGLGVAVLVAGRLLRSTPARATFVGLIAAAPVLVYYASELKQYAGDVTATLVLLLAYARRDEERGHWWLAGTGAVVVWFSHPAVIVLAGIMAVLAVEAVRDRRLTPVVAIGATWGVSGLALAAQASATGTSDAVRAVWQAGYAPNPFDGGLEWYRESALGVAYLLFRHDEIAPSVAFDEWFEPFTYALAALLAVALGVLAWARRPEALLAGTCLVSALVLAATEMYPFRGRLLLYLLPVLVLVLAGAVDVARDKWPLPSAMAALALVALVLVPSLGVLAEPHDRFDIEEALAIVADEIEPGDVIVLGPSSGPAFQYYRDRYGLTDVPTRQAPDYSVDTVLERAEGRRAWFVASHPVGDGADRAEAMTERPEVVLAWDRPSAYLRLVVPPG